VLVKRIVTNVAAEDLGKAHAFYADVLGLEMVMDLGCIRTYASSKSSRGQISFAREGGSGTAVPDLSVEVDDLDNVVALLRARRIKIEYGPVEEPGGVRRLFVRDPFGRLLNILSHTA
jgi:catechol 2,3-dioxygenase-like lactoylglutathione lyase family enzyme